MPNLEPTVRRLGAQTRRPFGTHAVIAGVCLAAIALMWIAVVAQARFERREAVAAAIERDSNLAVAFEEFTVRTIDGADAVARYVKREYARAGPGIDIPALVADRTIDATAFISISIVDEHGDLVATSFERVPGGPLNAADRPHFTFHVAADTGKVFVGQPIMSRLTGRSTIPISRRINKPDGSFGGIVSVLIEPIRFTEFYGAATLRPGDVIALVGLDGITRARRVGQRDTSGESLEGGRLMAEQKTHPSGSYLAPGRFDGVVRYYSYRTLRDYPLIVTVGVSEQDVLLAPSQRRNRNYFGAALVTGVMAFFAALLIAALDGASGRVAQLEHAMDDLNAVHGRLAEQASLLDKAQDAIIVRDLEHRITYWNKSAERLYGWTAAEVIGTTAPELQLDAMVCRRGHAQGRRAGGLGRRDGAAREGRAAAHRREPLDAGARRGRPSRRGAGDQHRHHRAHQARAAVPAGAAAGEHRHARRRHRPRPQQRAHADHDVDRDARASTSATRSASTS